MSEKQLVLGIFADEAAADAAVATVKEWDKASEEVELGAIGVLVVDDKGKLKEHKMGQRSTKKGAGIGLVLAIVAPPTLIAGAIAGGILGALHHKGLGLSDADRERLGAALAGGKAAVGILAPTGESELVSAKLAELGGTPEVHDVPDEALAEVEAASAEAETAEAATPATETPEAETPATQA
jgi:hypothetical protein